jgi:hypothetical protein
VPRHAPVPRHDVAVRHIVGSNQDGGYEWTAKAAIPRGVNILTPIEQGLITSFEAMYDGSRSDDDAMLRPATAAIEH